MISRLKDLEEAIKYKFNSKDLLTRCLTHKSYDEMTAKLSEDRVFVPSILNVTKVNQKNNTQGGI